MTLLSAKHYSKHFANINSINPHNNLEVGTIGTIIIFTMDFKWLQIL